MLVMVITQTEDLMLHLVVVLTSAHLLRRIAPARSMPWIFCVSALAYNVAVNWIGKGSR